MVSLKDVKASNEAFKKSKENNGLVAVFVGATSGIGMGTLKQFAKYANAPKVYIVGRSKSDASKLLNDVQALNPTGTFDFLETEVSLIKNVDLVCEEIKSKEKKVDILFMTVGVQTLGGRNESTEGLDIPQCLRYYSRIRFISRLLPLLNASPLPRVVSIFGGGKEKAIDVDDIDLQHNFTGLKASTHASTQTTLVMEHLAKTNPGITFIHKFPGFVNTGAIDRFLAEARGVYAVPAGVARYALLPLLNLLAATVDEAGERGVFIATSARYPPAKPHGSDSENGSRSGSGSGSGSGHQGVPLGGGVEVAESSVRVDGRGNGVYRLGGTDESAAEAAVLVGYRRDGVDEKIWRETQRIWEEALQRAA